jgi:arsenate reductase
MPGRLPRALFVCVHNAGRSQMAQAFWEQLGGEGRSAGSEPSTSLNPMVVDAMRELELDLAGRVPRGLDPVDAQWADIVVTMGCGDACPYIPGKRHVDWDLDDPAGAPMEKVRRIRDEVRSRVGHLAAESDVYG